MRAYKTTSYDIVRKGNRWHVVQNMKVGDRVMQMTKGTINPDPSPRTSDDVLKKLAGLADVIVPVNIVRS